MKALKIEADDKGFTVFGYRTVAIGRIHKEWVSRKKRWCLISDDLTWWRPDCLRQVAAFIESLDNVESTKPVRRSAHTTKVKSSANATAPQMPPSCSECPVAGCSFCLSRGGIECNAALWRHFF